MIVKENLISFDLCLLKEAGLILKLKGGRLK